MKVQEKHISWTHLSLHSRCTIYGENPTSPLPWLLTVRSELVAARDQGWLSRPCINGFCRNLQLGQIGQIWIDLDKIFQSCPLCVINRYCSGSGRCSQMFSVPLSHWKWEHLNARANQEFNKFRFFFIRGVTAMYYYSWLQTSFLPPGGNDHSSFYSSSSITRRGG